MSERKSTDVSGMSSEAMDEPGEAGHACELWAFRDTLPVADILPPESFLCEGKKNRCISPLEFVERVTRDVERVLFSLPDSMPIETSCFSRVRQREIRSSGSARLHTMSRPRPLNF